MKLRWEHTTVGIRFDSARQMQGGPGPKHKRSRSRRKVIGRLLFLAPVVIYVLAMFVYPLIYNVSLSFRDYTVSSIATGLAPLVGLANYHAIFSNPIMSETSRNTLIFVLGSIVFQVLIGMGLAIFFNQRFPLSRLLRTLMLIPWLLPLIVSGSAFKWILDQNNGVLNWALMELHLIHAPLGWLDSPHLALISVTLTNIWIGIPFDLVLFYSGLQAIPEELYEASSLDGANRWHTFWSITIPSMRGVIAIVLMLGLIYTLKVFDIIIALTGGGPANASQILSTWAYQLSFSDFSFSQGAAVANIMIIIALIFTVGYLVFIRTED